MASLTYAAGVAIGSNFVRVGHNSSGANKDAVWSFTPDVAASEAVFVFKWNNSDAETGWKGAYDYVFGISESSADGQLAASCTDKVIVTLEGASGTTTAKFTGLALKAGTTYYIRANFNGSTAATMKAFYQAGNTVTLTASSLNFVCGGEAVTEVLFIDTAIDASVANTVTSLVYNGNTIF